MIGTWFDRRFGDVVCAFGATLRFWREVIAVGLARSRSSAEVQGEAFLAMQGDSVGRGGGNAVGEDAGPSSGIELLSSPAGPTHIPASVCLYCFGPVADCCHSGESIPDDQPLGEAIPPGLAVHPLYAEIQDEFHRKSL